MTKVLPDISEVARHLLGDPSTVSPHELRYGSHGSLAVDLEKQTWFDHERNEGGGVLDLIIRHRGSTRTEARRWLEEEGLADMPPAARPNGHARSNGAASAIDNRQPARRIIATYNYADVTGRLLFQVVRYEPKTFKQRRPNGKGGWTWNLGGVEPVLYRLPELAAAETVFIPEGEKDVDRLHSLGLAATTNPGGVRKWRPSYTEALAGKHVVIIPDNDDAGRAHAHAVAAGVAPVAASVKVLELPGLRPKGDVSDWIEAGGTAERLRELVDTTPLWTSPTNGHGAEPRGTNGQARRPIRIVAGELPRFVTEAAEALAARTATRPLAGIYRRGAGLAYVHRLPATDKRQQGVRRAAGSLAIAGLEPAHLRVALGQAAAFEKWDGRRNDWSACDVPPSHAEALLACAARLDQIPDLIGIAEAPVLRPDGSVAEAEGYDPATGLLLDFGGTPFPRIPERPTREDAKRALALLDQIVAGFPFVSDADRSAALAMLLTAVSRLALRSSPLFAITAPKMASGKTLLATLSGYLATGRAPAIMSQAREDADDKKRLLAVLMGGAPVVLLDNLDRALRSDALCSILSEPSYSERLLGENKVITVPTAATFVATGNNLAIAGDLTSRALRIALDPGVERPEERVFTVDLHKDVPRRRGDLVAAALIMIRGYLVSGERTNVRNFARFEGWSRFCREPLVWLGLPDPCATRAAIESRDPVRERLCPLLKAWRGALLAGGATVAEAVKVAATDQALREALEAVGGEKSSINTRRVGSFLAAHEGRIEGGLRLARGDETRVGYRWHVRADGEREPAGSAGSADLFLPNAENCQSDKIYRQCGTNPQNPPNPQAEQPTSDGDQAIGAAPAAAADDPAEIALRGELE